MIQLQSYAEHFGVEVTHPGFPGNTVRCRVPECWFCGYLPVEPDHIRPATTPYRRPPFEVLGPFSIKWNSWQRHDDGSLTGRIGVEGWWTCITEVNPADDHVTIRSHLTNHSDQDWQETWAHYCMNMDEAPDFRDLDCTGMFIYTDRGLTPVMQTQHNEPVNGREKCNTYVPTNRQMPVGEYLYGCPISRDRAASPLIVRRNADGSGVIGVCYRHWYGLFYDFHPDNSCMHSEPYIGDLESGETRTVEGRLYWIKDRIEDVAERAHTMDHA